MKIKAEHLATIQFAISLKDTEQVRQQYRTGNFPRADKVKDLNKRYRWDLFYMTKLVNNREFMGKINEYLNDDHLDTALRSIVKPL